MKGITTTSTTPPWCGCGGCGGHSRLGLRHSGGIKRLSTARHPRGVAPPQPDTTWCGCSGCGSVVAVGGGLVAWRGCRRLCRRGGGGTQLVEMEVMVASNEDDSEGSGGGVVMMGGRGLKQREAWQRRGCAAAMTRSMMENDDDGSGALAGKFFRRPENAMEAPGFLRRSFFEYLHYELPEDVVSIIFGIILELQHDDCLV
ncbi:hypothetical protein Tco_0305226 [Tanacetum coccineum]